MLKYLLVIAGLSVVSACSTTADPNPYMGFDCDQLRAMSDRASAIDPFASQQVGPAPQAGLVGDREGLETETASLSSKKDDEARAIQAAYQAKSCT
jgi:hypothetical protein